MPRPGPTAARKCNRVDPDHIAAPSNPVMGGRVNGTSLARGLSAILVVSPGKLTCD